MAESQSLAYTGLASAKVNLFLEVVEKRADGFHNIESVFAEIDLADHLTMRRTPDDAISLETTGAFHLPPGEDNLVVKAAARLRERLGIRDGLAVRLEKRIPLGGGLGGGSSDAALTLKLANACFGGKLTKEELREIGAGLGSDVPFFFDGGVCVCRGRGEIVEPLAGVGEGIGVVLALTGIHCDTAAGYRGLRLPGKGQALKSAAFIEALRQKNLVDMEQLAFNRFEETVFENYPNLAKLWRELTEATGRPVRLSGSGGSLWFFAHPNDIAQPATTAWAKQNGVKLIPSMITPSRVG